MRTIRVFLVLLCLVLISAQGAHSDTPTMATFQIHKLEPTGPYDGRIQIEVEFYLDWSQAITVDDPRNFARIWCLFWGPDPAGRYEFVPTGHETLWHEEPLLAVHRGRIETLKELLTPPAASTYVQCGADLELVYQSGAPDNYSYEGPWHELSNLPKPTGENRNPTVQQPVISPTNVTTAMKVSLATAASDPDGDKLDYSWYLDGKLVAGPATDLNGITASDLAPGEHTVRVEVKDGKGGTARADSKFNVQREKNENPTVDLTCVRVPVLDNPGPPPTYITGQRCTADADDPDGDNKKLEYKWSRGPSGTPLAEWAVAGSNNTWAPIPPGRWYEVTVRVTDPDGGFGEDTELFNWRDKDAKWP